MSTLTADRPLVISINDQPSSVPQNSTLLSVLRALSHKNGDRVVVALNGVFVRSADWASQPIAPDDHLTVIETARV